MTRRSILDASLIGFTGSRDGMTAAQKVAVTKILETLQTRIRIGGGSYESLPPIGSPLGHPVKPIVGHGDCVGADAEFDAIATSMGLERHIYPCDIQSMRAHCELRGAIQISEPARPLIRNQRLVTDSMVMIATPKEYQEVLRSGTWSTIRHARKRSSVLLLVTPDGNLVR